MRLLLLVLLLLPIRAAADHLDEAFGHATDATPRLLLQARFCETPSAFEDTDCDWRTVTLPHRWKPRPGGPEWGLYRFDVPHPGEGDYGLVTERMALKGRLKVEGRVTRVAAAEGSQSLRLAYWPQLLPFRVGPPGADGRLRLDLAVLGHASTKSGLGGAAFGEQQAARHVHFHEMRREVFWPMTLAVTLLSLGVVGLLVGERTTLAGRIGVLASATAVAGGPAAVSAAVVGTIVLGTALLEGEALFVPSELGFPAIGSALLATEALLAVRAMRTRHPLALALLVPTVLLTVAGAHDLAIHFSEASVSDRYVTRWALPGLLLITTLRVGTRRSAHSRRGPPSARRCCATCTTASAAGSSRCPSTRGIATCPAPSSSRWTA